MAARVKAAGDGPDKFRLCGFRMMQGSGNTARHSVAVGVQGSTTSSGFHWPEEGDPHAEWTFEGNVSHNNALHGAFNWQNDSRKHDIENSVFYHNGEYGIDHGAYLNTYRFKGVTLYGNGEAAQSPRRIPRRPRAQVRRPAVRRWHLRARHRGRRPYPALGGRRDQLQPHRDAWLDRCRGQHGPGRGAVCDRPFRLERALLHRVGRRQPPAGQRRPALGSGRITAGVELEQPGAPPLARIPAPAARRRRPTITMARRPPPGHPRARPRCISSVSPVAAAHAHPDNHPHGEGIFGLTIPLLDEPLDAKHAIGLGVLLVLIPSLCCASVLIDRRYRQKLWLRGQWPGYRR